jgi:hypothetical protein
VLFRARVGLDVGRQFELRGGEGERREPYTVFHGSMIQTNLNASLGPVKEIFGQSESADTHYCTKL